MTFIVLNVIFLKHNLQYVSIAVLYMLDYSRSIKTSQNYV